MGADSSIRHLSNVLFANPVPVVTSISVIFACAGQFAGARQFDDGGWQREHPSLRDVARLATEPCAWRVSNASAAAEAMRMGMPFLLLTERDRVALLADRLRKKKLLQNTDIVLLTNTESFGFRDNGTRMPINALVASMSAPVPIGTYGRHHLIPWQGENAPVLLGYGRQSETKQLEIATRLHKMPPEILEYLGDVKKAQVSMKIALEAPGSGLPFHYHQAFLHDVIFGRKLAIMFPPGAAFPFNPRVSSRTWLADVYILLTPRQRPQACVVEGGELLYAPTGWWHAFISLGQSVAVAKSWSPGATDTEAVVMQARRCLRDDFFFWAEHIYKNGVKITSARNPAGRNADALHRAVQSVIASWQAHSANHSAQFTSSHDVTKARAIDVANEGKPSPREDGVFTGCLRAAAPLKRAEDFTYYDFGATIHILLAQILHWAAQIFLAKGDTSNMIDMRENAWMLAEKARDLSEQVLGMNALYGPAWVKIAASEMMLHGRRGDAHEDRHRRMRHALWQAKRLFEPVDIERASRAQTVSALIEATNDIEGGDEYSFLVDTMI